MHIYSFIAIQNAAGRYSVNFDVTRTGDICWRRSQLKDEVLVTIVRRRHEKIYCNPRGCAYLPYFWKAKRERPLLRQFRRHDVIPQVIFDGDELSYNMRYFSRPSDNDEKSSSAVTAAERFMHILGPLILMDGYLGNGTAADLYF